MIETQRYIRKPLYVDAVRVTAANFEDIAAWCQGEVLRDEPSETHKKGKRFIRVRVHNPVTPKQSKAYIGDWILYTDKGYKIYNNRAFLSAFSVVTDAERKQENHDFGDDDIIIEEAPVSDERLTGDPVVDAEAESITEGAERLRSEDIELVPATPEAIADAILENDEKRADFDIAPKYPAETTIGGTPREEINISAPVNGTVESAPEQEKVVPSAVEGKRVLAIEEQNEMTSDEVRDLVQSGEVVLAQDIAQP